MVSRRFGRFRIYGANRFQYLATTGLHPNLCRRFYEFHVLLPIHCQDARIPTRSNLVTYCASLFPSLLLFDPQLMALWTHRRTLLPYRHCMRDICRRPNYLHVNASDWPSIFRHVSASYGFVFSFSTHLALGLCHCCAPKGKESCDTCLGYSCV